MSPMRLLLFTEAGEPVGSRDVAEGELVIGRGEDVDWRLDDPERLLSRRHCVLRRAGDHVELTDVSTNGVFLGDRKMRCPPHQPAPLEPGQSVTLGDYRLVLERDSEERHESPTGAETLIRRPRPARPPAPAEGLLEAFCAGAGLEVSALANEDPAQLMCQLGSVYREMVEGLVVLMAERTAAKRDDELELTTIGRIENNPFRWTGADRLAADLGREARTGFLSGPLAVRATVESLAAHMAASRAGFAAVLAAVMTELDPETLEGAARARSPLVGWKSAAFDDYVERYERLCRAAPRADSPFKQLFRAAYARRVREPSGT
jgi:predicted component of type VI protein secretion system